MRIQEEQSLFDVTHHFIGCNYLSDLQCRQYFPMIRQCVQRHSATEFSKKEWLDLYSYLFHQTAMMETCEEIRKELLQELSGDNS